MATPTFPYTIERVTKLDEVTKQQIKDTFAAAFAKDEFTAVVLDRDTEFYGDFLYSTALAGYLGGEVYVAKADEEQGTIVGVAVWYPPGREMYDSEDQRKEALSILWSRFSESLKNWWSNDFLPGYGGFTSKAFGAGTKLNSWHLQSFGVHPDHQRRGIARALIERIKPKAIESNAPLCLEAATELNVGIYKKLGFEVKGETEFTGGTGSFPMWAMLQDVERF